MHQLDRIRIAGFKSIRDQEVELRRLNVLIGANGSGKSNFIGVFRLLRHLVAMNLKVYVRTAGGAGRFLHFGPKVTKAIALDLHIGRYQYVCELVPAADGPLIFQQERVVVRDEEGGVADLSMGPGHDETRLFDEWRRQSRPAAMAEALTSIRRQLRSWTVYHFHDTSTSAGVKQTGDIADNVELRPDAGNLAAFLYLLQETAPSAFRSIVETVRLVAPFFDRFELRPDRHDEKYIRLEWREIGSDGYFDADTLSDGTLRFICLATLLLQPDLPSLILIDEPELGLHPYAINLLASLLQSAAERTQVVVSTQSVTLVNQLAPEDVIVVDRQGRESVFRRPSSEEIASWLDEYALGELWEKNVLGGRPGA